MEIVSSVLFLSSALFGLWVFINPQKMIDCQIKFYYLINWKIEPVSMDKELRNTRAMGLALIATAVMAGWFVFLY